MDYGSSLREEEKNKRAALERELSFHTTQLGQSYVAWKEEEKNKETDRKKFFELAVEALLANESLELRTKVVEITLVVASMELASQRAAQKHPRYIVEGVQHTKSNDGEETYKVVLKENPEFVTFTYVN